MKKLIKITLTIIILFTYCGVFAQEAKDIEISPKIDAVSKKQLINISKFAKNPTPDIIRYISPLVINEIIIDVRSKIVFLTASKYNTTYELIYTPETMDFLKKVFEFIPTEETEK